MQLELVDLDSRKSATYIYNQLDGVGSISQKLIESRVIDKGVFYTILPSNIDKGKLYSFEYGGNFHSSDNPGDASLYSLVQDIATTFIEQFCKDRLGSVVMEDYLSKPHDGWVKERAPIYYMANGNMVYILNSDTSRNEILNSYRQASGKPFLILITDYQIKNLVSGSNLNVEDVTGIYHGLQAIFLGIYDMENFIFWFKNQDSIVLELFKKSLL